MIDLLIGLGIGIGLASLIWFTWWFPIWQARRVKNIIKGEKWKAENEFRRTLIQIIGGLIIIIGIFFSWLEFKSSRDEFRQSQENSKSGQISSRFSQAITLLSEDKTSSRVGAIYALEQIAKESPNYIQTVLDILTTFVKNFEYFKLQGKDGKIKVTEISKKLKEIDGNEFDIDQKNRTKSQVIEEIELFPEVQVALTVIGRIRYEVVAISEPELCQKIKELEKEIEIINARKSLKKKRDYVKKLERILNQKKSKLNEKIASYTIDLNKAILFKANLMGSDMSGAYLTGANLIKANLKKANLRGARLTKSNLSGADLSNADISEVNLSYFDLRDVNFRNAKFKDTDLIEVNLSGVDLSNAIFNGADLTNANLYKAILFKANLSGVDLSNSNLESADLTQANLENADLSKANLKGALLITTILSDARFFNANFDSADLSSVIGLELEQLIEVKTKNNVKGLGN